MSETANDDGWISVADRLPNIGITVEAKVDGSNIIEPDGHNPTLVCRASATIWMERYNSEWRRFQGQVTHWRKQR